MLTVEEKQQQIRKQAQKPIRRRKASSTSNFLKSFFASFLVMAIFATMIYWADAKNLVSELIATVMGKGKPKFEFNLPFSQRRQNILVMGVDVNDNADDPFKGSRTDTMVLVSIAPYAKDVNIISIPRDSKVYFANSSRADKINHAFAKGGVNLSVKTVEETFGVRVNHYMAISNRGLINFIDAIGGLPIYVEKDMNYGDRSAGLYVNLSKGKHVLTGTQAEGYLRFRHDALGDIGRIRRQQWFFGALLDAMKDPQVLMKMPDAIKGMPKYIQTDMSLYEISQYAVLAKGIDRGDIQVATVPGGPSSRGEVSYWILDPEKTQALIDKLVYRDKPEVLEGPLNVGILYNSNNLNRANELKLLLEQNGAVVKMQSREGLSHDQIAIHNLDVPTNAVVQLKKAIPEIKNIQTVYDQIGLNRAAKDFTVVLAGS